MGPINRKTAKFFIIRNPIIKIPQEHPRKRNMPSKILEIFLKEFAFMKLGRGINSCK